MKFLFKLLVSVSIIAYLFASTDLNSVFERMKTADPLLLIFATSLLFMLVMPQSLRWLNILWVSRPGFKFHSAVGITLIGWFFNQVLPSSVGGDAFRTWYACRFRVPFSLAAQSVIFDRISALMAVMMILLISSPWLNSLFASTQPVISILTFAFALLLACSGLLVADHAILFLIPDSAKKHVIEFSSNARKVFLSKTGLRIITLSAAIHFFVALAVWLLAQSMGITLNIFHSLLLMPVILFITAVPVSIAGWGIRESAMVVVFGMVGMPSEQAISLSLSFGLIMLVTGLPGGIVWWFMHHEVPNDAQKTL